MSEKVVPIRSTTQRFVEIESIERDIVLFTDGSCAMTLTTTAVNFGLLSEKEQDAIIYAYAGFLNSLSFPIQILVRTQHKDISSYLSLLKEKEGAQKSPHLKQSIAQYRSFVETTVKERDVLDKKFYIIIPFSRLELGTSTGILFGNRTKGLPYPKEQILDKAITILTPKRDHIVRLLSKIGLKATQLTNSQLAALFFSIYNPGQPLPSFHSEDTP